MSENQKHLNNFADEKIESFIFNHFYYKSPSMAPSFQKHSHNTYEILFFEKGSATYIIEDKKYRLKKNDLIFIRPAKYHYIELDAGSEYSRYNLSFDQSITGGDLLNSIPPEIEVVNCPKESIIAGIISRMDYYYKNFDEKAFCDLVPCLLKELLYNLRTYKTDLIGNSAQLSPLLTQAIEYINANLFTLKDVKEISAHLYISEQYLFRQFQTQLKITPKKYINAKRLLYAQNMLRQGVSPTEIYLKCGFESYPGFYKQYLKTFGYPPSKENLPERLN